MTDGNTWRSAAIGAVVTIGLSFTGVSPLLGGGVAGYLQQEPPKRGAVVGAISGVIATVPMLFVMVLAMAMFAMPTGVFGVPGGLELVVVLLIMLPMLLLWFAGLGAAGGYIGAYLSSDSRPPFGDPAAVEQ